MKAPLFPFVVVPGYGMFRVIADQNGAPMFSEFFIQFIRPWVFA